MGYLSREIKHLLFVGTICLIAGLTKAGNNDQIEFQCPTGWTNINYMCYKSINKSVTWDIADNYCKSIQSELVKIPDYWTNKEIGAEALKNGLSEFWIGFTLLDIPNSSGYAHWSNGEDTNIKHGYWADHNPNVANGKCSYETQTNEGPKWVLGNCDVAKAFVCEKPACTVGTFMCGNSRCIGQNQICDGKDDCQDGTDEQNCPNLCQFYQTGLSGSLNSTNFPQNYPANSFCLWKIQSDIGTSIHLTFSDFITEANTDIMEIFVGSLSESDAFLKYRLSGDSVTQKTYTSPNNMMLVKLSSDSSVEYKGFKGTWTTVSSSLQSLKVNAYPSSNLTVLNFMNNEQNTFTIRSVTRRKIITLEKLHMNLLGEDEVVVFNGDTVNSPVLATYKRTDADLTGPRFMQSTGEAMMILLKSRGLFANGGFVFSYSQDCEIAVKDQLFGEIMSPGYDLGENYPNSLNCKWNIEIPTNHSYSLKFDSNYDIDSPDDVLYVYNLVDSKSVLIFNSTASSSAPTNLPIASGAVQFMFTTNSVINKRGFKADYSVDCPDPIFNENTETTPVNSNWHYTSTFNVYCKPGYGFYSEAFATNSSTTASFVSQTQVQMICLKGGKWNVKTIPQCWKKYCGPVQPTQNGRVLNATGVLVGDVALYTCLDGYTINGNDSVQCQENGTWEAVPKCTATGCSGLSNLTNGQVNITEGTGTDVGSVVFYTCDDGYQIDGVPTSQCDKSGTWSSQPPSCHILNCSDFGLEERIPHAKIEPSGDVHFGQSKNVSCDTGYHLNGTSPIVCLGDQSFGKLPTCEDTDECSASNLNQCNQICVNTPGSYYCKCKTGFQLKADNVTCEDINECDSNNGDCEQKCNNIAGSYECACNEGFDLYTANYTMKYPLPLGESGSSNGDVFYLNHSCVPVLCQNMGNLVDGHIQPQRKFSHFGDTLYFSCDIGFMLTGAADVVCLQTGNWSSNFPTCKAITCTPEGSSGQPVVPYQRFYNFSCEIRGKPKEYRQRQCLYDPITHSYKLMGDSYVCEEIDCGQPRPIPGALKVNLTNTTYGSQHEVKCSDLYVLRGNTSYGNIIHCGSDGKWNYGDIKCDGVQCDFPPVPIEGTVDVTGFAEGSIATYNCTKEGYAPRSVTQRTCAKNSKKTGLIWDQYTPKCVDVQSPTVKNGRCNESISLDTHSGLDIIQPEFVDNSGYVTVKIEPKDAIAGFIVTKNMTIVYTATDASGNEFSCFRMITVEDRPLKITCPRDIVEELKTSDETVLIVFTDSYVNVTGPGPSRNITFRPKELNISDANLNSAELVVVEASVGTKSVNCTFYVFATAKPCSALSSPRVQHATWDSAAGEFTCKANYSFPENTSRNKMTVGCISSWNVTYTSCSKLETYAKFLGNFRFVYTYNATGFSKPCAEEAQSSLVNIFATNMIGICNLLINKPQPTPINSTFNYTQNTSEITFHVLLENVGEVHFSTNGETECFASIKRMIPDTTYSFYKYFESFTSKCGRLDYKTMDMDILVVCNNTEKRVESNEFTYCVSCPPGSYYDLSSGNVTYKLCPLGEYQDNENQMSCKKCPNGTSTYSPGGYAKDQCRPQCPAGFFSDTGNPPCKPCPVSTYSVNATSCQECPQGTKGRNRAAPTKDSCKDKCKVGHFSLDGYEPCYPCPLAFYTNLEEQTTCFECANMKTTASTGADNETLCLGVAQILCKPNPCQNSGECVPLDHLFTCNCSTGFTGERCNETVNPCLPNPCYYGGTCSKDGNSYKCGCLTGTNGQNCQLIIENCKNDTCENSGICRNKINGVQCYCDRGYDGELCQNVSLPCKKSPCKKGSCKNLGTDSYKCDCIPGYKGHTCDKQIDNCASSPCLFNSTCINLVDDFSCNCTTGYSGKTCSQRADLCNNVNCSVGTCIQNIRSETYTCSCDAGYTYGEYCQFSMKTDNRTTSGFYKQLNRNSSAPCITECLKDAKCKAVAYNDVNETCSFYDTETDACCKIFTKECQTPTDNFWTPWYPITDSVEPAAVLKRLKDVGIHVCDGEETSITQCKMEEGEEDKMRPDKYEMSLDLSKPCMVDKLNCKIGNESECSMYRVRFQCAVSKVMQNNQCEKKSACHDIHCENGAKCSDSTELCNCSITYKQPFCRVRKDFCSQKSCGHGSCINGIYNATCDCPDGFEGPTCTNINDCKDNPCNATGTEASGCQDLIEDYQCPCKAGFKGKNCTENIDECQSNPCLHKGVCNDEVDDFSCNCPDGWTGKRCEKLQDYCKSDSCVNNGVCLNLFKSKYCRCQSNTYGLTCSDSVSICKDANPCLHDVNCTEFGGKAVCNCKKGYTGVGCQIAVDFCKSESEVCANGGTCVTKKDGYKCQCQKGFEGPRCEKNTNDCTTSLKTCEEPKSIVCDSGKSGPNCNKNVSSNYDLEFYLHEKNGMATLKSAVFVPKANFSISVWVRFKEMNGKGTFLNLFMIRSKGITEEKIPVLRINDAGITYTTASGVAEVKSNLQTLQMNNGKWNLLTVSISDSGRSTDPRLNNVAEFGKVTEPIINFFGQKCVVIIGCYYDAETNMAVVDKGFYGELSQVNLYNKYLNFETDARLLANHTDKLGDILAGWEDYILGRGVQRIVPSKVTTKSPTVVQTFINVKSCPKMVNNYGSRARTLLEWTTPQFTDNSRVEENYRPDTTVVWGRYAVTYKAKNDKDNVALCNFMVYAKEKNCTKPDDPYKGTADCTDLEFPYYSCNITCDKGRAITAPAPLLFTCGPAGWWHPNKPYLPMRFPSCGRIKKTVTSITLNLSYAPTSSDCSNVKAVMKPKLIQTMITLNNQNGFVLCTMKDCLDIVWNFLCDSESNAGQDLKVTATINAQNSSANNILTKAALDDKAFDYGSLLGGGNLLKNQFSLNTVQSCGKGEALIQGTCVECTPGTYLNMSTQCDKCPVGTFQADLAQINCSKCPENQMTLGTGHMNISACKSKCPRGEFFDSQTNNCTKCDIVSYQDLEGQFFCKTCSSGRSTKSEGAKNENECTETCPAGYEFTTNCTACMIGYYRAKDTANTCMKCTNETITLNTGSTRESQCNITACFAGTYLKDNICIQCEDGYYQDTSNQKDCKKCPTSHRYGKLGAKTLDDCKFYCESGFEAHNNKCQSCLKGTYKNNSEDFFSQCKPCPGKMTTITINSTSESDCKIYKCPAGQQPNTTQDGCERCPFGTYQPEVGQEKCIKCTDNQTTPTDGSIKLSDCNAFCESGFETDPGQDSLCKECGIGYFKDNGQGLFTKCQLCPNGNITEKIASISEQNCTKANCSAGQYLDVSVNKCFDCNHGYYQDEKWKTSCNKCPNNDTTYTKGADNKNLCLPSCGPGSGLVDTKCQLCSIGYYHSSSDPAQTSCKICPDHFVTPKEGAVLAKECTVLLCPAGKFVNGSTCSECLQNSYQDKKNQSSCTTCPGGKYTKEKGSMKVSDCLSYCTTGAHNCSVNSTCKDNTTTGFQCDCKQNFIKKGGQCLHICDIDYCLNGATCSRSTVAVCACGNYYKGQRCENRKSAKDLSKNSTQTIIGAVVGVLAGILIVILIVTYVCVRMRRKPQKPSSVNGSAFGGTLSTKFAPNYMPVQSAASHVSLDGESKVFSFTNAAYNEDSDPAIYKA